MKNLLGENQNVKGSLAKWGGRLLLTAVISGAIIYVASIREQLSFTLLHPSSVASYMEAYYGEHNDADKRLDLKNKGQLLSPLAEEAKKE